MLSCGPFSESGASVLMQLNCTGHVRFARLSCSCMYGHWDVPFQDPVFLILRLSVAVAAASAVFCNVEL